MFWVDEAYGDPKYGNGKWFLNPKNHSRQMYKVKKPGQKALEFGADPESQSGRIMGEILETRFTDPEKFQSLIKQANAMKGDSPFQIGQVITLAEAYEAIDLTYPVASMACICRLMARAREERNAHQYSCTGLGVGMLKWERWPERYRGGVNFMDPDEAKEWITKWDKKGMVHILMTFGGSYVGGICNCDYPDCGSLRFRVDYGVETMCYKSHYVAKVDYDECNGCGVCVQRCQFGALKFEATMDKPNIDHFKCFGCGLCHTACPRQAIKLLERLSQPGLQEVW